jgi:hypothetical protein
MDYFFVFCKLISKNSCIFAVDIGIKKDEKGIYNCDFRIGRGAGCDAVDQA